MSNFNRLNRDLDRMNRGFNRDMNKEFEKFDKRFDRAFRAGVVMTALSFLLSTGILVGVIFVAIHFLSKVW